MKFVKTIATASLLLSTLGIITIGDSAHAAQGPARGGKAYKAPTERFSNLKDSDKILVLPDGGFLHGEATITDTTTNEIIARYNSETDSNSVPVSNVKTILNSVLTTSVDNVPTPRRATPPNQSITLGNGGEYSSSPFSASGWRFGGYLFQSDPSTGPALLWASYKDSGVVGTETQAWNTLNSGTPIGESISAGGSTYIYYKACYYTYNPISGSYYYVANK
ncbi:hypothetical protein K9D97_002735 [Enterococcus faecalis]|nr:hypothetical protein [Enterococcus faecalis]